MAQASNAARKYQPERKPAAKSKPAAATSRKGQSKTTAKRSSGRPGQKTRTNAKARAAPAARQKRPAATTNRGRGRASTTAMRSRAQTGNVSRNNSTAGSEKKWYAFATTAKSYMVLIPTVSLLLLGLVMVFSAGQVIGIEQGVGSYRYFILQSVWACLGFVLLVFFAKFDYHKLGKISGIGFLVAVGLLVLVLIMGRDAGGAKRWLEIGFFNLQPTEIAKFTLMVYCAYILAYRGKNVENLVQILPVLLAMALTVLLFMMQPDLGSAIVICVSVFILLVISGAKFSHLVLIGAGGASAAIILAVIEPYRMQRILAFLQPEKYQQGASYQLIQSYIALGSGNIKGLGLGMSKQKFMYLPNAHNDFIFSIIGEELGLIGTLAVVILICLLMYGGYRIAKNAPDQLGRLFSVGIVSLIVVQAIVNMGGVTGLMPITGVPLPLVSFGGSSLCICMGCIGILLNVAAQSDARIRRSS